MYRLRGTGPTCVIEHLGIFPSGMSAMPLSVSNPLRCILPAVFFVVWSRTGRRDMVQSELFFVIYRTMIHMIANGKRHVICSSKTFAFSSVEIAHRGGAWWSLFWTDTQLARGLVRVCFQRYLLLIALSYSAETRYQAGLLSVQWLLSWQDPYQTHRKNLPSLRRWPFIFVADIIGIGKTLWVLISSKRHFQFDCCSFQPVFRWNNLSFVESWCHSAFCIRFKEEINHQGVKAPFRSLHYRWGYQRFTRWVLYAGHYLRRWFHGGWL